jgi:hypothetical protein
MGNKSSLGNKCSSGPAKFCMNRTQFDNLHGFAEFAGAKLVFGLAMPQRNTHTWNSTDARALITYAISSNKSFFAFELGNEQCGVFTAAETAVNFAQLSVLLSELYPDETTRPKIIGPDPWGFHRPFNESGRDESTHESDDNIERQHSLGEREGRRHLDADQRLQFITDFVGNCTKLGVPLHALSHHEYIDIPQNPTTPVNGNATLLDYTRRIAEHVNRTLASIAPKVQIWAGEVGPHNGGTNVCEHGGRWANWGNTFW